MDIVHVIASACTIGLVIGIATVKYGIGSTVFGHLKSIMFPSSNKIVIVKLTAETGLHFSARYN